mmetsp:Transcript_93661/g.200920  ORF Transcript_93661/g.200920 Transcript_93661/m.200920 type:complete len:440 (+) Transcript_93661:92-1411(+)
MLDGNVQQPLLETHASGLGSKTIGFWGGVMLFANSIAGPTISLMPKLALGVGWLPFVIVMAIIAVISALCAWMVLTAIRRMPDNQNFERRVEFLHLTRFYLWCPVHVFAAVCYTLYLIVTLMTYMIQTAQILDYAILDICGCAYGFELWPHFGGACGTAMDATSPFLDATVVSVAFAIALVLMAPLARLNLDDNVVFQWMATCGLSILMAIWLAWLVKQPQFPQTRLLPAVVGAKTGWGELWGVLMFNFALVSVLPSWANEKRPEVSVGRTLFVSISYIAVLYAVLGLIGGLCFGGQLERGNLFSMFNGSGSTFMRFTVIFYPLLQNFTSIPVFSILIKYNLIQAGLLRGNTAAFVAFVVPWVLSILLYTGDSFERISSVGGLVLGTIINYVIPVVLIACSLRRGSADDGLDESPPNLISYSATEEGEGQRKGRKVSRP